jgi:hypothetical protein
VGEPYREAYRVEDRIRPLTEDEEARVRGERAAFRKNAELDEPSLKQDVLVGLPLVVGIVVLAIWRHSLSTAAIGLLMAVVALPVVRHTRRAERARRPRPKELWAPPSEEGWKVREITVVARSTIRAASNDEDYITYLLFEIPGADWFFLAEGWLPEGADPARAEMSLVALHPKGPLLTIASKGEPIPVHGEKDDSDGYVKSVERRQVWRPRTRAWKSHVDGVVPESALPKWVRKLVGSGATGADG